MVGAIALESIWIIDLAVDLLQLVESGDLLLHRIIYFDTLLLCSHYIVFLVCLT